MSYRPFMRLDILVPLAPAAVNPKALAGQSPATWYWFALNGEHERPLFAFPGIWQRWKGPVKKDGPNVEIDIYAFMTTEPNALTGATYRSMRENDVC